MFDMTKIEDQKIRTVVSKIFNDFDSLTRVDVHYLIKNLIIDLTIEMGGNPTTTTN